MDEAKKSVLAAETVTEEGAADSGSDGGDAAKSSKMKVRVVLRSDVAGSMPARTDSRPVPKPIEDVPEIYDYRIDRIALAVLGIVLILAGLYFLVDRLFQTSVDVAEQSAVTTVSEQGAEPIIPELETGVRTQGLGLDHPDANQPTYSSGGSTGQSDVSAVNSGIESKPVSGQVLKGASPIDVSTGQPSGVTSAQSSSADSAIGSVRTPKIVPQSSLQASPKEVQTSEQQGLAVQASAEPSISVLSESISRASLNWRVVDLEPGRAIDVSPIVFKQGESIKRVFFYTQLNDMKDSIFYYHWFLDGQPIAKVKVGVWSNRWRSYSSKQILRKQAGRWSVVLMDSAGNGYAKAEFEVVTDS